MTWTTLSYPYGSTLSSAQMTNLFNNFAAMGDGDPGAPRIGGPAINAWPFPFGVGSRGVETISANAWKLRGVYEYDNFTLSAGAVLSVSNPVHANLILLVRGTADIRGTINLTGQGGRGGDGSNGGQGNPGSLGGGGGGALDAGSGPGGHGGFSATGGPDGYGAGGGDGSNVSNNRSDPVLWRSIFNPVSGVDTRGGNLNYITGGGGGGGVSGANGGGAVVIICDKLNFTGNIICDGNSAAIRSGGGGGGCAMILTREIISNTGSLSAEGGGSGTGGSGGSGFADIVVYSR